MEELDAYCAGLIDGEGTVTLSREHANCNRIPVVSVTSTTRGLLEFLQDNYGGNIRVQRTYKAHHSAAWVWSVRHDRAIHTLRRIRPFLRVPDKIRRADLIIEQYKSVTPRNGKYTAEMLRARRRFEESFFHPSTP